jgi:MFS family permease
LTTPAVRVITIMFTVANVGTGMLSVLLPVYAREVLHRDVSAYGSLLTAMAIGTLAGSVSVGSIAWPWPLGRSIAAAQLAWGIAVLGLVLTPPLPVAIGLLAAVGLLSSPLTVWAQTVRMGLIPPHLRGRAFGLLRTLIQSSPPIGGAAGGFILAGAGVALAVVLIGLAIATPGALGLMLQALSEEETQPRAQE